LIHFRKLKLGDIDNIYRDEELKKLLVVDPRGEKFAIVMEEEGKIIGGASGYIENSCAMLQAIVVKDKQQSTVLKDGLLRSLIHILDLEGMNVLLTRDKDLIYEKIGFNEYMPEDREKIQLGELISEDLKEVGFSWLNIKDFFRSSCNKNGLESTKISCKDSQGIPADLSWRKQE
jgi:N-acetylglutamate synthase-like GNAT family acetyltransferase